MTDETVLQGMIDRLTEIGRCYGMETNVEKTKVMRISRQPTPVTTNIDQKQLENVKCFKYLGTLLTDHHHIKWNNDLLHSLAKLCFCNTLKAKVIKNTWNNFV
jgi:hypothetical protein